MHNNYTYIIIMETVEDIEQYISGSKININNFISKNEYKKAFGLMILFLERLDDKEKSEVINYYSKNMKNLGVFNDTFPSR